MKTANLQTPDSISTKHPTAGSISRNLDFAISSYSLWCPNLPTNELWLKAIDEDKLEGIFSSPEAHMTDWKDVSLPSVKFLPIAMRKKLSPVCKLTLSLVNNTLDDSQKKDTSVVMASRHGESKTIVELLTSLGNNMPSSPMAFSRSVHNSSIGLWSIAASSKVTHTSIAAMENSFRSGLIEALIQLHSDSQGDPKQPVLYVFVDDTIPEAFKTFINEPKIPYGGAFLLTTPEDSPQPSTEQKKIEQKKIGQKRTVNFFDIFGKEAQIENAAFSELGDFVRFVTTLADSN